MMLNVEVKTGVENYTLTNFKCSRNYVSIDHSNVQVLDIQAFFTLFLENKES